METWVAQRRDVSTLADYINSAPEPHSSNPIIIASLTTQPASSVTDLVTDLAYNVRLRQKSPTLMQLTLCKPFRCTRDPFILVLTVDRSAQCPRHRRLMTIFPRPDGCNKSSSRV